MSKQKEQIPWKEYEELIFNIYKELESHADVKLDDSIIGIESEILLPWFVSPRTNIKPPCVP